MSRILPLITVISDNMYQQLFSVYFQEVYNSSFMFINNKIKNKSLDFYSKFKISRKIEVMHHTTDLRSDWSHNTD